MTTLINIPIQDIEIRVESLIATAYFKEGRYKEAIAIFNSCDIDALADNRER